MAGAKDEQARTGMTGGAYVDGTASDAKRDVVEKLNSVLRGELSATETYRQALDKIRDEYGHDSTFQQLA